MIEDLLGLLVAIPALFFTLCILIFVWSIEIIFLIVGFILANPYILLIIILVILFL